jgi:hypothetical protein
MIERVNPEDDPAWDAKLRSQAEASLFHSASWHRVLRESYDFTPSTFIANTRSGIAGLLPMLEIRSPLTGNRGVSLPFTDECEPLCHDENAFRSLFDAAVERGHERRWKHLEFRGGARFFPDIPSSVSFFGHTLALESDTSGLLAKLDSSTRRAIRKAQSSGLTIEFTRTAESVSEFYELLSRTRQRHGLPPQPRHFFTAVHRYILAPGQGWIVLAKQGAVPVAGAVFFHFGSTAIYKYGASDEAYQALRGNNLVMWSAIQRYAKEGMHTLNFGRTSLRNEGLRRFKLGWGSSETQIDYFKYDLRTRCFVTSRDEASGWHNRVFQLLPRPLSRMIGSFLYKHIA